MKCKVISLIKVKQGNHLPYFIVRAIGIENEEDAEYLDEDDYWNSLSPLPKFEKKLFPPTESQVKALENMYTTDSRGNVIGNGPFIRLMSYKWKTPSPYFISRPNSVTGVCERVRETKDFRMRQGKMYNYIKTEYIPEVFTFMTLTFLETENGECAENGGDAEGLCKTVFEKAVTSGYFLLQKSATHIKEVVEIEEIDELESRNSNTYDELNDYYNNSYYNGGLDMDQQDERFWNF